MRLRTLLAALSLSALPFLSADAQHIFGPFSNCSGTIGGTAGNVTFPSSGTGAAAPTDYFILQNNSTGAQIIWLTVLPGGTATTAPPSIQLTPSGSVTFNSASAPVPSTVSIIASAAGAAYSCWYK